VQRAREVEAEEARETSGVSAEGAPGKAWVGRMPCENVSETLQRNPAG
jgi:hypothetical protein